jgi:hypothetical protein
LGVRGREMRETDCSEHCRYNVLPKEAGASESSIKLTLN